MMRLLFRRRPLDDNKKSAVVLTTCDASDFAATSLNNYVLAGVLLRMLGVSIVTPLIPIGDNDIWMNHSCIFVDMHEFFIEDFGKYECCLTLLMHHLRTSPYFSESQLNIDDLETFSKKQTKDSEADEKELQDWREMDSSNVQVCKQMRWKEPFQGRTCCVVRKK